MVQNGPFLAHLEPKSSSNFVLGIRFKVFLEILDDARAIQANEGVNNKYDVNNKDDARTMQANKGVN